MRVLLLTLLATTGCTVVEADQVAFDKVVGSAYGAGPCDCKLEGGNLSFLCVSDGDVDTISVQLGMSPGQEYQTPLRVTTSEIPVALVGNAVGAFGTLGEPTQPDPTSIEHIRSISGIHFEWAQQDVCSTVTGCDMGKLPIHSGKMLDGHGGREGLDAL